MVVELLPPVAPWVPDKAADMVWTLAVNPNVSTGATSNLRGRCIGM